MRASADAGLLGLRLALVGICCTLSFVGPTGCATAGDLRTSVGAKNWNLSFRQSSYGQEHSLSSDKLVDGGVNVTLYNYCDRKSIHLHDFEDPPRPGKPIELVTASGNFSLKYLGMQMGTQVYGVQNDAWDALKTSKWVKLTFESFEKSRHFVEVNFDMTYFPILIKSLDEICK